LELKIIGGTLRGRKVTLSDSLTPFRPTKSMVREAICSSINMDISGSTVLELCAGSGIFSLELLSRGAKVVTAVESDSERCRSLSKFSKEFSFEQLLTVKNSDVSKFIDNNSVLKYDIIFFDPPYYEDELTRLVYKLIEMLNPYGVLIFEFATDDKFASLLEKIDGCNIKGKKYGKSSIKYFRKS
jgi:16S rRNA (guanine966-N2)-methyltransferase